MFPDLAEQLRAREQKGLRRYRQVVESPQASHITIDGRNFLAFSSNDYLGLANHPDLIQSACEGAQQYGVGAGASHLINGHSAVHHILEDALAHFFGVWAQDATIVINTGAVTANKVDGTDDYSSGGGLYLTGASKLTLNNVQVDRNQIDYLGNGGGLHVYGTTATLNNVTLNNNKATNAAGGGGLHLQNGSATINGLTANGNTGLYSGGGIETDNATLNLSNATLQQNEASAVGGGIRAINSTVTLNGLIVSDHDSGASDGAGIDCYDCQGSRQNLTVSGNVGDRNGGGLHADSQLSFDTSKHSGGQQARWLCWLCAPVWEVLSVQDSRRSAPHVPVLPSR